MAETNDILGVAKMTINASVKCNTVRGYIGWHSCDNICMDMYNVLDMCEVAFRQGKFVGVLEAATYVLVSGVKLASYADSRDKGYSWHTAIGLQAVDGLKTSRYLIDTAIKNIEGDISLDEAQELLNSYYEENPKLDDEDRTEEADKVACCWMRRMSFIIVLCILVGCLIKKWTLKTQKWTFKAKKWTLKMQKWIFERNYYHLQVRLLIRR